MKSDEVLQLIEKYLSGTATDSEKEELLTWYRSQHEGEIIWEVNSEDEEESEVKSRMLMQIQAHASASRRLASRTAWVGALRVAAVLLIGVLTIGGVWWKWKGNETSTEQLIAVAPAKQFENRFVILPDSSKVLLRPGSTLEYVTDFSGRTREVSLRGEGYFDVKPKAGQPFIIHTGKVKTTVLGTSFTIKADDLEQEVSVTVQRGKVLVEDEQQVLAELTDNQQVVYTIASESSRTQDVEVGETLLWTTIDMSFDDLPFKELATRLGRRYGVSISFEHAGLENCPISGRFSGTESLEEVLDILSLTRNTTYKKIDGTILVSGKGCNL